MGMSNGLPFKQLCNYKTFGNNLSLVTELNSNTLRNLHGVLLLWALYIASVPKDRREGLENTFSVR